MTVTDQNGCNDDTTVTVEEPDVLVANTTAQDSVSCNGLFDGLASVTAIGGNLNYTYQWDVNAGSQTTDTATNLGAGTYTVTVTDQNGCNDDTTVTVEEPDVLVANTTAQDSVSCNGLFDGLASVTAIGGNLNYTYQWDVNAGSQTTDTATNLGAGTYTVTVTDQNGCNDDTTVTVEEPDVLVANTTAQDSVSCNGLFDGLASVTAIGGNLNYTYQWDVNAGSQTTDTATNLGAGTYTVTVTDQNGCNDDTTVTVEEPDVLVANTTAQDSVSCNGLTDGSASVGGIVGGNGIFSYTWIDALGNDLGQDNDTATNLGAGTYTVTVTDQKGCNDDTTVTVEEPDVLVANTTAQDSVSCNGLTDGLASVTAIGGNLNYTYQWDVNAGSQTTDTATNLGAGTYTVTVTDQNGCNDDTTVTVEEPDVLVANTTAQDSVSCNGLFDGLASVTAIGGNLNYTYQWDVNAGSQTTDTATNLGAGTYTVTVTDQNGCNDDTTVTVEEPDVLVANTTAQDSVSCNGLFDGLASVTAIGGNLNYTYQWDVNAGSQTTDTATNLGAGTYTVTVTDQNGCNDDTTVTVEEPDVLVANTTAQDSVSCNGLFDGLASVTAIGGNLNYTYQWDVNAGSQTTDTATNLGAGTYTVTVTDQNGCNDDTTVTVEEPDVLVANTTAQDSVSCNGLFDGLASVTAIGGNGNYTYQWDVNAGSQTTDTATNLGAGTYTVTVTDQNGCNDDTTVTVEEPDVLVANTTAQDSVSCNGLFDGLASVTAIGGNLNYTYQWDVNAGSQTTDTATNLGAGTYTVTVTDQNGCNDDTTVTVEEPDVLVANTTAQDSVSCNGLFDGLASVTAIGGNLNYTYQWDVNAGSQTTDTATNLGAGTYTVTVTDQNGCNDDTTVTVEEPDVLVANTTAQDSVSCNGLFDGLASVTAIGGNLNYTYQWDVNAGSQTTDTATNLGAGTYTVTVTDQNGCNDDTTVTVGEPNLLVVDTTFQDSVSCNGLTDGSATVIVSGGNGIYSYQWDLGTGGQITDTAINLGAGTYNVTVLDQYGCNLDTSVIVFQKIP